MSEESLTSYQRSLIKPEIHAEVFKLILILEAAKDPIYPSYLLEKLRRILNGTPIALDGGKQHQFNIWKEGYEGHE